MQSIFQITIEDYLEVIKRAKANGKVAGDDMSEEFSEYIQEKKIKSCGSTELTKEEYIKELVSHDKNVLSIEVDKKGNTSYNIAKKLDKQQE